MIAHDDQFRGVQYSFAKGTADKLYNFVNPDYFRLVAWEGEGLKPVGYGYDSVEANVRAAARVAARAGPRQAAGDPAGNRRQGPHRHAGQLRVQRAGHRSRPPVDHPRRP